MRKRAHWQLPEIDLQAAETLASEAAISRTAARVLLRRGIRTAAESRRFLEPQLSELHDPFLLRDMLPAAERLAAAVGRKEKILLYGDYDADGTTSVVILKKAIELAGGEADFHVPHRIRDGYGMRSDVIERAAAGGVSLIVSVDTGIRAGEVVRQARNLGIDVIVTDHHLPDDELPPALAVLNPNRPDCDYPDKNLCGAAVAMKLAHAFFRTLGWPEERQWRTVENFLKMVAIATVADVVPLVGENRVIVKHGLQGLCTVKNPGLRALMEAAGMNPGEKPRARSVAFRLAPRINAAGRMDDPRAAIELFLCDDPKRARMLAAQLDQWNSERRATDAEITNAILAECESAPVTDEQFVLVFSAEGWYRGVLGIVAGRLAERFHRPVVVLDVDPRAGEAHGSGRSAGVLHLMDALEAMQEMFIRFGGHSHAAGLVVPAGRIDEFRNRLNQYAAQRLTAEDLRPTLEIDAVVELSELGAGTVAELNAMEPFGQENPPPLLAALGSQLDQPAEVFGEKHLKLRVRQNGHTLLLKGWNMGARAQELRTGQSVDIAFELTEGEATLRDVRIS